MGKPIDVRDATFSEDRVYRYRLTRRWSYGGQTLNVIGLNPSTADEKVDDPTIRRCIRFAKDWGYIGLTMTNLCAFRATKPIDLWQAADPSGPDNDGWLRQEALAAGMVLVAWGANIMAHDAGRRAVREILHDIPLRCLGLTQSGAPRHPLYVPKATRPIPFEARP
jgi:hypothetical protein